MTAPVVRVEIGYGATWQTEPGDISWVDETSRVLVSQGVACTRGASSVRGDVDTGELEFVLRNEDRRFDPTHGGGPLFGSLLPGTPVRLLAEVDGVVDPIPVWEGTVPAWPQRYDVGNKAALVPIHAYDRFDKLSRAKIPRSVIEREVLTDHPYGYWPLDEASGSTIVDRSGNGYDGLADYGATALATRKETTGGAEVRGLDLVAEHRIWVKDQAAAILQPPAVIEAVVLVDSSSLGGTIYRSGNGNPNDGIAFQVNLVGAVAIVTGGIRAVTDGIASADVHGFAGTVHHIAYRLPAAGPSRVYVDGVDVTETNGTMPTGPVSAPGVMVAGRKTIYDDRFAGFLAHVASFDTDIGESRIAAHAAAVLAPLDGQRTDERVEWVLDEIGWPAGLRDLSVGRTVLGPATFKPGDNALEYLRLVADTEDGALFVAADGKLTLHDRYWRYLETPATTSQFTFTDNPGAKGYADFELDLDDELLVNVARYARRNGIEQTASDVASVALYGEAEERKGDLLLRTDAETRSRAQWAVLTKGTPLPRVPFIRLPLHAYAAADQETLLGLDLEHRVSVKRTPQGVGAPIELDFLVRGISHEIGATSWWMNLYVEPVPEASASLFILDESELDGPDVLAH